MAIRLWIMSKHQIFEDLKHAGLVAAGAVVTTLENDGFADEFGGAAIAVAGVLGIIASYLRKENSGS